MANEVITVDLTEKGRDAAGNPAATNRRLFMQFRAYGRCGSPSRLMEAAEMEGVVYADVNDPQGVGLLTWSESPDFFVEELRHLLNREPLASLAPKPELTMFGRTYAIGYERPLEEYLVDLPRRKVTSAEWPWAIWYPLRREGAFGRLPQEEQMPILQEHGKIGRAFGKEGLGYDVRLACHGLDRNDNDFVVGLIGPELHPLSAIVEAMRKTTQTAQYLRSLGPFFVGKAIWQRMQ